MERATKMKRQKGHTKRILSLILIWAMICSCISVPIGMPNYADEAVQAQSLSNPVNVTIRVEANDTTLVPPTTLSVENFGLENYGGTNADSPRVIHALIAAMEKMGLDCKDKSVLKTSSCTNVDGICGLEAQDTGGWMFYINREFSNQGVYDRQLKEGDSIVFFYVENWANYWYSWFDKESITARVGEPVTLTLEGTTYDMYKNTSSAGVIVNADLLVDDRGIDLAQSNLKTDAQGKAVLNFNKAGTYSVSAERKAKDGKRDLTRPYAQVNVLEVGVVDKLNLVKTITGAEQTLAAANPKEYLNQSIEDFKAAIDQAKAINTRTDATSEDVAKAETNLKIAETTFKSLRKFDKGALTAVIQKASAKKDTSEAGTAVGQYPQAAKEQLASAIEEAKRILEDGSVSQETINQSVEALNQAVKQFEGTIIKASLDETIAKTVSYYQTNVKEADLIGEIALFGAGVKLQDKAWEGKYKALPISEFKLPFNYPGATAIKVQAALAQGIDVCDYEGRNLFKDLSEMQQADGGFSKKGAKANLSDQYQVMMVLDAGHYAYNQESAVRYLLKYQQKDGGFASSTDYGSLADTGQVLQVLANHKDILGVPEAIQQAIAFIKSKQDNTAEFVESNATANPVAMAKAVTGLVACGENLLAGDWVKGNVTVADALLKYRNADGSFFSDKTKKTYSSSATGHTLVALGDLQQGKIAYMRLSSSIYAPVPIMAPQAVAQWYQDNKNGNLGDWWELVAVRGAGIDFASGDWTLKQFDSQQLNQTTASGTDYAGVILGMLAKGEEPSMAWGNKRNLLNELKSKQVNGAFEGSLNNHVWAMIALDSAQGSYDSQAAVSHLLSKQLSDGGFALWGSQSSPDDTAMVLCALSAHRGKTGVNEAIQKAVANLKAQQLETGGFSSWGAENANSIATVITGLVSVGENPLDKKWIKNGNNIQDALVRFQLPDKSFAYDLTNFKTNGLATKQALIAVDDLYFKQSIWSRLPQFKATAATNHEPLKTAIADAVKRLGLVKIGNGPGQYPESAVKTLQEIIDRASVVEASKSASQLLVSELENELKEGVKTFKKSGVAIDSPKPVQLRIEGIKQNVFENEVVVLASAESEQTALDALVQALDQKQIPYELKDSTYGAYLSRIGEEAAGKFGGYDGWNYSVNGISPSVGISEYKIKTGDEVVFYYGGMDTLTPEVAVLDKTLEAGKPWQVKVTANYDEWNSTWTEKTTKNKVISDAEIHFEGKTFKTNEQGIATVDGASLLGKSYFTVGKERAGNYPELIRSKRIAISVNTPAQELLTGEGKKEIRNVPVRLLVDGSVQTPKLVIEKKQEADRSTAVLPYIDIKMKAADLNSTAMSVTFPQDTQVVGPAKWTGEILLPQVVIASSLTGISNVSKAIELGVPNETLSFDKPIRILFPDQAGKNAGFIGPDQKLLEITSVLSEDSYELAQKLPVDGVAKVNAGKDLVIWTKHFTKFITYTASQTGGTTGGSTGGTTGGATGGTTGGNTGGVVTPPANEVTTVYISITGKNGESFFGGNVVLNSSDRYGKTAMGALDKTGVSYVTSSNFTDFVTSIGGQSNSGMNGWMYKVNGTAPNVLAADYPVSNGSQVQWFYSNADTTPIAGGGGSTPATNGSTVAGGGSAVGGGMPIVGGTTAAKQTGTTVDNGVRQLGLKSLTSMKLDKTQKLPTITSADALTKSDKQLKTILEQKKEYVPNLSLKELGANQAEFSLKNILALAKAKTPLMVESDMNRITLPYTLLGGIKAPKGTKNAFNVLVQLAPASTDTEKAILNVLEPLQGKVTPLSVPTLDLAVDTIDAKSKKSVGNMATFGEPVWVQYDLSGVTLKPEQIVKLSAVQYNKQKDGTMKVVKLGGVWDEKSKVFGCYINQSGLYGMAEVDALNQVELKLNEKAYLHNGVKKNLEEVPYLIENRAYVPMASLLALFDGKAEWRADVKMIDVTIGTQKYTFETEGATENGMAKVTIKNGRSYLSLSEFCKLIDARVIWMPSSQKIQIVK